MDGLAPGARNHAASPPGSRILDVAGSRCDRISKWRNQFVAVKLRLVRMGKKKQPTYRVVAADSRSPRDGRFLEIVGTYAPRGASTAEPDAVITIDNAKAVKWLVNGAKPTERVERLLKTSGAWDEFAAARAK
jgi:small subunit ribosomal protein S16